LKENNKTIFKSSLILILQMHLFHVFNAHFGLEMIEGKKLLVTLLVELSSSETEEVDYTFTSSRSSPDR
jgi:hypothetical protein